jgi:hypothetical protein
MNKKLNVGRLLFFMIGFVIASQAWCQYRPLTRGAQPGEIYLASYWANRENGDTEGVLFSTDHGQSIKYQSDFKRWTMIGDYTSGTVLGLVGAINQFQVSYDYGISWDSTIHSFDGFIYRGTEAAELYNFWTDFSGASPVSYVKRSVDNGFSYGSPNSVPDFYLMASGSELGHVYGYKDYTIWHSADFGQSFEQFAIDSSQILYYSCHTNIVPGVLPAEVYLVSFEQGIRFHIYRSDNYGQTFTHMFQSDSINPLDINNLYFCSGLVAGEFYWVYEKPENEPIYHSDLYINYSTDFGQTYQTYYHDLSQFVYGVEPASTRTIQEVVKVFPQPVSDELWVTLSDSQTSSPEIVIYDVMGNIKLRIAKGSLAYDTNGFCIKNLDFLSSGCYILCVMDSPTHIRRVRFIKA